MTASIRQQKIDILPILEKLTEAKEEHLLECFRMMLKHYSKFRTTSTQFPLSPIDESSVLLPERAARRSVGRSVVPDEMGGAQQQQQQRMHLKTRTSRNMFKTSLEDLKRLATRPSGDLKESIAIVVEMRSVANSLGVVFAPYEGITDTVRVMHRYCKVLCEMLEQTFPEAQQEKKADAANQATVAAAATATAATAAAAGQQAAAGEAAEDEQFAGSVTDQMHVLTI